MPGAGGGQGDREENGLCERARTWQHRRLCGTSSACSITTPHAMGGQPAAIIPLSTRHSSASPPSSSSPGPSPTCRLSGATFLSLLLFLLCSCLSSLLLSSVVLCSVRLSCLLLSPVIFYSLCSCCDLRPLYAVNLHPGLLEIPLS